MWETDECTSVWKNIHRDKLVVLQLNDVTNLNIHPFFSPQSVRGKNSLRKDKEEKHVLYINIKQTVVSQAGINRSFTLMPLMCFSCVCVEEQQEKLTVRR